MGTGKTYSTKYLLDSNNNRGAEGQVLSTTSTGIDWVDANTVPGTGLWLETGNDIYNSNSANVGIGTTTPGSKLELFEVSGGAPTLLTLHQYAIDIVADDSMGSFIDFKSTDINANFTPQARIGMLIRDSNGDNGVISEGCGNLVFHTSRGTDAAGAGEDVERMRITDIGNVGIGTDSPNTLLDVSSANFGTTAPAIRITNTLNVGDWSGVTSDLGRFEFFTDDSSGNAPYTLGYIGIKNDYTTGTPTLPSGAMVFATTTYNASGGPVERMRVTSIGKVGIGTANPQDALDIDWDTEDVATDNSGIRVRAYRPHLNLIDRSGYTTTNGHNFQIKADSAKLQFNATSADNETFDLTRMVIDKDGQVGIGTFTPTSLLEISQQLSAASTIDYPYTISSRDDDNSIDQAGGEGVGIKFRIAGNDASTPGNSLVGASIAAIRESSSDSNSSTGLGFFVTQNDETLDEAMRITNAGGISFGSTGTAYGTSGQVLTSAGNAAPTWETPTTGTVTGSGSATQVAFWDGTSSLSGNSNLYWDATNDHLGIGDSTPGSRLKVTSGSGQTSIYTVDINHVRNDADVATIAQRINMDLSGADTTTADRTNYGLFLDIDSSANGDASNEHRIYGVGSFVNFTGFTDLARGGHFVAESNYTGAKTSQLVGVYGQATHDTNSTNGGVSNMYGAYGTSSIQDLGDVDNAFGGYFSVTIGTNRGNADVGVTKGVEGHIDIDKANTITYGDMMAVSGIIDNNEGAVPTFGNQYLFKGDYQGTRGGNAYGVYCEGDKHYFEGKVGIGVTGPAQQLHIVDTDGANIILNSNTGAENNGIWMTEGGVATPYANGAYVHYDSTNNAFKINTGTTSLTTKLAILRDSGNVGIGTTSPSHKLEVGLTDTVPLASQPAIPLMISNDGNSVDGRVLLQVKHDVVNTAGAIAAGFQMTAAAVTSGTASYYNSLIFLESAGSGSETVHSAPKNIEFYTNNSAGAAGSGTSYTDLGNLAFELQADGEAIFYENVGINTTTPYTDLEINGGLHVGPHSAAVNPTEGILVETAAGDVAQILMYVYGSSVFNILSDGTTATIGWGSGADREVNFLNTGAGSIKVGIADGSPSYTLDVTGTIRATGDIIAFSDVRVKENIKTIKSSLDKVSKLRGVEFNKIGEDEKSIGVIAQEIEKVIPEVVKTDDEGMKSVAYGNISGLLIEAIKELKAEVDLLKSKPCNCNCKK